MLKTLILLIKAFILGLSMLIPGLSGGTMAFIMGIYEKIIKEISKLQIPQIKSFFLLFSLKNSQRKENFLLLKKTWDWAFLIPLKSGILISILLFVFFAPPLIEKHSLPFYSLIFGLVLASVWKFFKEMKKTARTLTLFLISLIISICLFCFGDSSFLFSSEITPFVFLLGGFLAGGALVIPGLSGSYCLLILGIYEKTILALKEGDLLIIINLILGAGMGLLFLAKAVHYLLKNYFHESIALILGLILASLYQIYPLPKESISDLLLFNKEKQIFLYYSASFFVGFFVFDFLYKIRKQ